MGEKNFQNTARSNPKIQNLAARLRRFESQGTDKGPGQGPSRDDFIKDIRRDLLGRIFQLEEYIKQPMGIRTEYVKREYRPSPDLNAAWSSMAHSRQMGLATDARKDLEEPKQKIEARPILPKKPVKLSPFEQEFQEKFAPPPPPTSGYVFNNKDEHCPPDFILGQTSFRAKWEPMKIADCVKRIKDALAGKDGKTGEDGKTRKSIGDIITEYTGNPDFWGEELSILSTSPQPGSLGHGPVWTYAVPFSVSKLKKVTEEQIAKDFKIDIDGPDFKLCRFSKAQTKELKSDTGDLNTATVVAFVGVEEVAILGGSLALEGVQFREYRGGWVQQSWKKLDKDTVDRYRRLLKTYHQSVW